MSEDSLRLVPRRSMMMMVNVYDGDGDDNGSVIWNHLYKKYY